jgi:hypothetical protein
MVGSMSVVVIKNFAKPDIATARVNDPGVMAYVTVCFSWEHGSNGKFRVFASPGLTWRLLSNSREKVMNHTFI